MAKTKSKEDLIRLSWIAELRRQGDRQCKGNLHTGTRVCALGLLAEVCGLSPEEADKLTRRGKGFGPIGAMAGLDGAQTDAVWWMNDGRFGRRKHTFGEIADVVARWFPRDGGVDAYDLILIPADEGAEAYWKRVFRTPSRAFQEAAAEEAGIKMSMRHTRPW